MEFHIILLVRHLVHWLNLPIFDNADILTIGYAYPNLQMSESYNAPGSPYWAMKAFMFLGLPADHPFWRAEIEPLPQLEPKKYLEHANMLIQRGGGNVVALIPGRLQADGHSHTVEKYSKFSYSTKFGFSIMRSNVTLAECAPDSMLAFEAYGYFFVKDIIEPDFEIDADHVSFSWTPIKGIHVRTRIELTQTGHIRIHEITSDVECRAYDCGFAVSTDDRRPFDRQENAAQSVVENQDGYCRVTSMEGTGEGKLLIPDPNTNLMNSKTTIPMAIYTIVPGTQTIRTKVDYL